MQVSCSNLSVMAGQLAYFSTYEYVPPTECVHSGHTTYCISPDSDRIYEPILLNRLLIRE